jgi:hypothetical protein
MNPYQDNSHIPKKKPFGPDQAGGYAILFMLVLFVAWMALLPFCPKDYYVPRNQPSSETNVSDKDSFQDDQAFRAAAYGQFNKAIKIETDPVTAFRMMDPVYQFNETSRQMQGGMGVKLPGE